MKTTVIPAQITTVEDTIAGNLNLTQIVLLVTSLFVNMFIYALVPKQLSFSPFKLALIGIVFAVFIALALRIKGRLVLNWILVFAAYALRPHIYIFNKNTLFTRDVVIPKAAQKKTKRILASKTTKEESLLPTFDYQSVLRNPAVNLHFKKGRILVAKTYD